jgi:hypothetical protein
MSEAQTHASMTVSESRTDGGQEADGFLNNSIRQLENIL